jgi:anti-anti-sigma regulatory factor
MNINTHLEDFSNEIFFEIFDYLHMFDIFTGFTLLNRRISSILQLIPLHIVISRHHSRRQIDFLSSHLTFHEHQVISINISDIIRDDSSIIRLLFNRHNFPNLKSCKLVSIKSITRLGNMIEQIRSLNSLVVLKIFQPAFKDLNENGYDELTRIVLTHKSSTLRSVRLQYPYHYLDISNYTSIGSNLTSLSLRITGSPSTVSVHSVLQILRLCHRVQYLYIILEDDEAFENNNVT